jgi:hypothetical protein
MIHILDTLTSLGISFSLLLLLPLGILLGIIFGLKASSNKDQIMKKKDKCRMWWSFATPFVVIIFLLIITGLLHTIVTAVGA